MGASGPAVMARSPTKQILSPISGRRTADGYTFFSPALVGRCQVRRAPGIALAVGQPRQASASGGSARETLQRGKGLPRWARFGCSAGLGLQDLAFLR